MIQTEERPLQELFDCNQYAWELLECEVKLETSDAVTGEDVSNLLQLYMKGVEKMNSFMDYRESFFKEKVLTLMSRPTVIKTLNNSKTVMGKKNVPAEATTTKSFDSPNKLENSHNQNSNSNSSGKKIENKAELLHLKEKKKEIEVRLAYGAEETNQDALAKILAEQNKKESLISTKISRIVDKHEDRLMNRIKERKLKTIAARSESNLNIQNEMHHNGEIHFNLRNEDEIRDEDQFNNIMFEVNKVQASENTREKRPYRSLSPKKEKNLEKEASSPLRRTISYNIAVHVSKENIKLWNFHKPS